MDLQTMSNIDGEGDDHEDAYDPLLAWMKNRNIPVTRQNYLDLAYPDSLPEEWTAELETQLPRSLRRPLAPR